MSNDPKFKATEKGVYLDGKEMADGLKAQRTLNKNSNTTMRRIRKIRPDNNPRVKTNAGSRIVRERKPQQIVKKRIPATVIPSNRRVTISRGVNNKPSIYAHVKPIWLDETVFIIGGGPSLKGFNWSLLAGKKTIAINRAIQFYPKADALYFTDGRVYSWYKKDIDEFKGLKYTIRNLGAHDGTINILRKGVKFGLEAERTSLAHGNNSGYAAINLAVHLGAKKIILLGYDMGNDGTVSHFHDGYPVPTTSEKIYRDQFIPGFTILRELLFAKGIQCYNASIHSKLDVFPKIGLDRAFTLL